MDRLVASSSMSQVNRPNVFIPLAGPLESEERVLSMPSLDIGFNYQPNKFISDTTIVDVGCVKKQHNSWDDVRAESCEDYPASCMQVDKTTSCIYIDSSVSSSSNSISLSDTLHMVRKLNSIYDNNDSQSLLEGDLLAASGMEPSEPSTLRHQTSREGEISFIVPSILASDCNVVEVHSPDDTTEKEEDDNSVSTTSSISPSHGKLGVPSKAAAILGAREIFTSPSHAAYRRLVDFTHRPTCDGPLLKTAETSTIPSPIHPSLTARNHRRSKPDTKITTEASPEKKAPAKYKIINMGLDEMKEKFNFLRKPGDPVTVPSLIPDNTSSKSIRLKEIEKLVKMGKLSAEQTKRWDESFEQLLNDKYGLALFHDYLKSEYSEENIEFWIACEEFKTLNNPKKLASRAQKIIRDFVTTQAPKEVNIDSKTRQITLESIHHPTSNMFDLAQKRVQSLMEIDSYQRFLRSEVYQALIQDIKHASSMEAESPGCATSSKLSSMTRSAQSSIDVPDSDSVISLMDIRSSHSFRKTYKHDSSSSSIIRISSVRSTKSDTVVESSIPPSSSENCLKNSIR